MEDIKKVILEYAESAKKSKFYFKDIEKAVQKQIPDAKMRVIKKACTELINEEKFIYFSTGSSTMYGLAGKGMTEDPE